MFFGSILREGNIFVRDISSHGMCQEECFQIKKIEWNVHNEGSKEPKSVIIRAGLSDFDDTIDFSSQFCYMAKPYKLNYLLLHSLGFQYSKGSFTKTCILKNESEFIKLDNDGDNYKIDSKTINKEDILRIKNISALSELQDQVRELFGFELCVDVVKCNHILCMLCELQFYVDRVAKETEEKGGCYTSRLPRLLQTNPYAPMPESDVNIIVEFLCDIEGYKLKVDMDGYMYLTK